MVARGYEKRKEDVDGWVFRDFLFIGLFYYFIPFLFLTHP